MKPSKIAQLVLVASVTLGAGLALLHAEDTTVKVDTMNAPATQPAATPTTKPVSISADAQKELDALAAAYNKLTSLETSGTIAATMDIAGKNDSRSATFNSSYQAPNRFRHSTQEDLVFGSTGEKSFIFMPADNAYYQVDAGKTRADFAKERSGIVAALDQQDYSMLLAMSDPPTKFLLDDASDVSKTDDVQIDGKGYPAVLIKKENASLRLAIDPQTHLLRQAQLDMAEFYKSKGAPDVKAATVTFDYKTTSADAAVKPEQFAWTPPADAKDKTQAIGRELLAQGGDEPAQAMVGKPAPAFTLTGLDDKKVSLADLKGSVVVLDFWATWCGPCVAGLPHVDKLYADKKDAGLKVYAVNQAEDKDHVSGFLQKKGWKLPVLLDSDQKVAEQYMVEGIPHQVVIGKDGLIKKVIIGFNPNEPEQLRKFVEQQMEAK